MRKINNALSTTESVFEQTVRLIIEYCENNPDEYRSHTVRHPITIATKLRGFVLRLDDCDISQLCNDLIEPHFGIKLPADIDTKVKNVGDLCTLIDNSLILKPRVKIFSLDEYGKDIEFCKNVLGYFPFERGALEGQLKHVLQTKYSCPKHLINSKANLHQDLNINSLNLAEIIIDYENKYGCSIDITLDKISTFENLCDLLYTSIVKHASETYENYKKNNKILTSSIKKQDEAEAMIKIPTRQELLQKVISEIKTTSISARNANITEKTNIRYDLDLTSLDIAEVCINIEQFYGFTIEFSTAWVETVEQLVDRIYEIMIKAQQKSIAENSQQQVVQQHEIKAITKEIVPFYNKIQDMILSYNENNEPYRIRKITRPIPGDKNIVGKFGLGFDELDKMQLIMEIEKEFKIEIPQENIDSFKTVRDIVMYVFARVQLNKNIKPNIINTRNQKQK